MYPFIESIAFENNAFTLLPYHQQRVNSTFSVFYPGKKAWRLAEILSGVEKPADEGLWKVRLHYGPDKWAVEMHRYIPQLVSKFVLIERPQLRYAHKSTNREVLDSIYESIKNDYDDFIITQDGMVTDCYYANMVFFDGVKWWTPKTYLLNGTRRRALLASHQIEEKSISLSDLKHFTAFKRINALIDLHNSPTYSMEQTYRQ